MKSRRVRKHNMYPYLKPFEYLEYSDTFEYQSLIINQYHNSYTMHSGFQISWLGIVKRSENIKEKDNIGNDIEERKLVMKTRKKPYIVLIERKKTYFVVPCNRYILLKNT